MQFRALVAGRVISYPQSATFTIEQRTGNKPYSLLATKATFESALAKFHRAFKPSTITRLSYTEGGRFKTLITEHKTARGLSVCGVLHHPRVPSSRGTLT